jgi:flavodoxin
MRRVFALLMIAAVGIGLLPRTAAAQQGPPAEKKILIVYLSRTNNTKTIAEIIHQKVGGKLVALELQTPYPADYHATVQQVVRENETDYLPPLRTVIDDAGQYDVVFVGFPTWDMKLPPPIKSFLHQNSFPGKTIIPFNSNGGYGPGSTFRSVRELCPQSTTLQGFSTRGGLEKDGQLLAIKAARAEEVRSEVDKWLRTIGMLKQIVPSTAKRNGEQS